MKAYKVFEKFEEKSDPISDMGIGIIADLQKRLGSDFAWGTPLSSMSYNEMLMNAISFSGDPKAKIELANYAIKNGADQLWFPHNEPKFDRVITSLVVVTSVRSTPGDKKLITYKTVWRPRYPDTVGKLNTTVKFYQDFLPVTENIFDLLDSTAKNIIIVKNTINELQPKLSSMTY